MAILVPSTFQVLPLWASGALSLILLMGWWRFHRS